VIIMATIEIPDVPDDAHEIIRRRARQAGQSMQSYLRDHVVEFAKTPTKAEAIAEIEAMLRRYGGSTPAIDQILADVFAHR
jgi:antitoxin FitA